jgi:hypothetical protein
MQPYDASAWNSSPRLVVPLHGRDFELCVCLSTSVCSGQRSDVGTSGLIGWKLLAQGRGQFVRSCADHMPKFVLAYQIRVRQVIWTHVDLFVVLGRVKEGLSLDVTVHGEVHAVSFIFLDWLISHHNLMEKLYTVEAPNFWPHGNFVPLFQKALLSLKRVLHKNDDNKSCTKTLDLQIRFCSFFCTWFIHRSYRGCKKKSKVSMRSDVRGFYGILKHRSEHVPTWLQIVYL